MALQVNDLVDVNIIENGYWKDSVKGKIVGETAAFWIVDGSSHRFWNSKKEAFVPRRFSKAAGNVTYRAPKKAA